MSGRWQKDRAKSDMDAYDSMLGALGLKGLKRIAAVKLINGVEIKHASAPPQFTVRYIVSQVKFLDNVEEFNRDQVTKMNRRDGQPGQQIGSLSESDSSVQTTITWEAPNPGMCLVTT